MVALESLAGIEGKPIKQDELMLLVGGEDTLPGFNENIRGMEPGSSKEFDVTYPEDYGEQKLAGKTVRFRLDLKAIRAKELPEINDEFAKDLGDYKDIQELREAVKTTMMGERELMAQQAAKDEIIDQLVKTHDFPIPEVFLERQIEATVEQRMRELMNQGVDPKSLKLDWQKIKESQSESAKRDVKASLLLDKIAERETIETTVDEVDQEVERIAKMKGEPFAVVKAKLEEDGQIRRMAARIRTEKTLNLLFEQARKVAPEKPKE